MEPYADIGSLACRYSTIQHILEASLRPLGRRWNLCHAGGRYPNLLAIRGLELGSLVSDMKPHHFTLPYEHALQHEQVHLPRSRCVLCPQLGRQPGKHSAAVAVAATNPLVCSLNTPTSRSSLSTFWVFTTLLPSTDGTRTGCPTRRRSLPSMAKGKPAC